MVFIDVSKAFDRLALESLLQAYRYIRLPNQLSNYLKLAYEDAAISFRGTTIKLRQTVGIKQEDPPSGPIFNASMNMGYEVLNPRLFYVLDSGVPRGFLLYADDRILTASSKDAAVVQFEAVKNELAKMGLNSIPAAWPLQAQFVNRL